MRGDSVHQWRRQAVVWLQSEFLQLAANSRHSLRIDAAFDQRRHEGGEIRGRPAGLLEQLGMHEVEAMERMARILDAAVHVNPAPLAGVALDRRGGVHHFVQPQTWSWATCPLIVTFTGEPAHWHTSVPPAKSVAAGLMP